MNRIFSCILLLMFFVQNSNAQQLKFNADKKFRILQFTDTHIIYGKKESMETIHLIEKTAQSEKPDLIFLTGDLVTGTPAKKGWELLLDALSKTNIPFVLVLGNHDAEHDVTRAEIAKLVTHTKNNYNTISNGELADFALEIKSSQSDKIKNILFGLDSQDNSKIKKVSGYDWFHFNQIQWFREKSDDYKNKNQGEVIPALAFFHIPLPEYKLAFDKKDNKHFGERLEDECPADINAGMFASFIEKGNIMGTFVGHDHNNDYITSLYGIAFAYGRFSGSKNTYTDTMKGARVIDLAEDTYGFETYIILENGEKSLPVNFPQQF